jgi:hypothetical protein
MGSVSDDVADRAVLPAAHFSHFTELQRPAFVRPRRSALF